MAIQDNPIPVQTTDRTSFLRRRAVIIGGIVVFLIVGAIFAFRLLEPRNTFTEEKGYTFTYPSKLTLTPRSGASEEELEESCPTLTNREKTYAYTICGPYNRDFANVVVGAMEYADVTKKEDITINGHTATILTSGSAKTPILFVYIANVPLYRFENEEEMDREKWEATRESMVKLGLDTTEYDKEIEQKEEEEHKEEAKAEEEVKEGTIEAGFFPGPQLSEKEYEQAKGEFLGIVQSMTFSKE